MLDFCEVDPGCSEVSFMLRLTFFIFVKRVNQARNDLTTSATIRYDAWK